MLPCLRIRCGAPTPICGSLNVTSIIPVQFLVHTGTVIRVVSRLRDLSSLASSDKEIKFTKSMSMPFNNHVINHCNTDTRKKAESINL